MKKIHQNLSLIYGNNTKDMLGKICHEKTALTNFDYDIYARGVPCDILKIKTPISFVLTGLALAKNSEFKDLFNYM